MIQPRTYFHQSYFDNLYEITKLQPHSHFAFLNKPATTKCFCHFSSWFYLFSLSWSRPLLVIRLYRETFSENYISHLRLVFFLVLECLDEGFHGCWSTHCDASALTSTLSLGLGGSRLLDYPLLKFPKHKSVHLKCICSLNVRVCGSIFTKAAFRSFNSVMQFPFCYQTV